MKHRQKHPKTFGRRPILMQRYEGGLRIIYPNGKVGWTLNAVCPCDMPIKKFIKNMGTSRIACTARRTQKAAYAAAVEFDHSGSFSDNYSAFLGYL